MFKMCLFMSLKLNAALLVANKSALCPYAYQVHCGNDDARRDVERLEK